MFMTNQSCKRQKRSSALHGQPEEDQNEQQQQKPANHSSDNAEIAHCLTPFSHSGNGQLWSRAALREIARSHSKSIFQQQFGEYHGDDGCY